MCVKLEGEVDLDEADWFLRRHCSLTALCYSVLAEQISTSAAVN